jgi:hypothetical protein
MRMTIINAVVPTRNEIKAPMSDEPISRPNRELTPACTGSDAPPRTVNNNKGRVMAKEEELFISALEPREQVM